MKKNLLFLLLLAGFMHADAQFLKKVKARANQTVDAAKTTAGNKVDERTAQAASQKTDKVMDKVLNPKISFKKKKKRAEPPVADSTSVTPVVVEPEQQSQN